MLNGLWAVGVTRYPVFGEFIDFNELLNDFKDKDIKLSVTYDEDYGAEAE